MTLETCDLCDIWSEWWGDTNWPKKDNDQHKDKERDKDKDNDNYKDNPSDLWQLRHWRQFWKLRTWIHDNLCYLTIRSDTGQHSQFLRCFLHLGNGGAKFVRWLIFKIRGGKAVKPRWISAEGGTNPKPAFCFLGHNNSGRSAAIKSWELYIAVKTGFVYKT